MALAAHHPTEVDHVRGDPGAPVVLLEYGDYQCPYCAAAAPVLRELVDTSGGAVRLVFRNFPLVELHPYALTAALAVEAAAAQGAFWDMHELVFGRQDRLTDAHLAAYAEQLGLDGDLVVGDPAQRHADKIEEDYLSGQELGVEGTPWLFVNGRHYTGRMNLTELRRVVNGSTRRRLAPWPRR